MKHDISIVKVKERFRPNWISMMPSWYQTEVTYLYDGKQGTIVQPGKLDTTEEGLLKSIEFAEYSRELEYQRQEYSRQLLKDKGA